MKQIFVINKDLKMRKGKAAVQVAHGETYYMYQIMFQRKTTNLHLNFDKWFNTHMPKIVLKATEQEMIEFETNLTEKGIWTHRVYDLGKTQVPANSFTCLVVEPLKQSFNEFKLL